MSGGTGSANAVDRINGLIMTVVSIGVIVAVYLGYQGAFSNEVNVLLRTQRAGLLLDKGAAVRILGIRVGTIRDVSAQGDTAVITIGIKQDRADDVPSNALVQLKPTTIFGAKYVELEMPRDPSPVPVAEGAVLKQSGSQVESNEVFKNVVDLLTAVQPQKVNSALSAVAGGLAGRGQKLGTSISQANDFLGGIEPSLDDAERDLTLATRVIPIYQKAYPSLVSTLDNFRTTSATLVTQRPAIGTFLQDLRIATGDTTALLVDASGPLGRAVNQLDKPTATLQRYAPEFSCFIKGAARLDQISLPAFSKYKGVVSQVSLMPRAEPYSYPEDLPKVAADNGPNCYGLPFRSAENPIGQMTFDTGITP
jgi:phospholipid/cholesterol/gamma-HCH transport system substrate-binding protein